eukprot:m.230432 g.230432  ORF g.230432 m.230432 type:complete len:356 (-) comp19261_c0_seq2:196-1263(-)
MVCGGSEASRKTKAINARLKRDNSKFKRQLKILLLGTGESGKSTVIKQMKIIYGSQDGKKGFDESERAAFKNLVCRNVLRSAKAMIDAMDSQNITIANKQLEDRMWEILDEPDDEYDDEKFRQHADFYDAFWKDEKAQEIYSKRNAYQLSDSTKYFFNAIERIRNPSYIPDVQDVLRAREATTGIHEFLFDLDQVVFRMLDVGGQRSERRKWIHCFEQITSVIFIIACSEYDQHLVEQTDMNRMVESIALFEQIVGYYWFKNTSFILFLNKQDLLQEKIKESPLKEHFPDFQGPEKDATAALDFISNMYTERAGKHELYPHPTTATDTGMLKNVFESVKSTLVTKHLRSYGLYND